MGGVVGAIAAPLIGGLIGGGGSQQAASTAAGGQIQGMQAANQQLGMASQQAQQNVQPYMQAGQQALGQYQNLLNGGAANFDISKLPGYNFQMQQGTDAIQNSAAARGQALSGNTLQGLQQYGQGLASTQFQNYMSQLQGLAGMGLNASQNLNQNQVNLAQAGAGYSQAGLAGAANANAGGIAGVTNAALGTFNNPGFQQGLGQLFNSPTLPPQTAGQPSNGYASQL